MIWDKVLNYEIPAEIGADTKEFIRQSFFNAANEMDQQEFEYIHRKIEKKIEDTKNLGVSWISELSLYFKTLYEAFKKDDFKSPETTRFIGAALFYFINPFDIIPDHTPEIGYIDDFYVLITCLKSLDKNDQKVMKRYFEKLKI